jgi:nucleoside-diphosphate-sugar epimerase
MATVVHCAASVRFDLSLEEARATNVEGTRRVAQLAGRARERGAPGRLVHVSTAYVHGRTDALGREDGPGPAPVHRNTYEVTKHEAEQVARALGDGVAVVRPSIVVGDSVTGWTSSFNVIYVPLRAAAQRQLTVVPGPADAWLDLIPVDQVASVITALALRPELTGTFQAVAGPDAPRLQPFADAVCRVLDIPPPACEPAAAEQLGLYAPYVDVAAPFELTRARELGVDPVPVDELVPRLLAFAEAAGWGRTPLPRAVPWGVEAARV